ncbi:MAG TPA: hypothetical protein VEB22_04830 [Phycisphaerales bacterium]|nr:hypothetical protein [Phycisphaerales bacterium]
MSAPIVPTKDQDFVSFMSSRAPLWVTNRALIGLSTTQTTAMTDETADVVKYWDELADAKLALRQAQDNWKNAKRDGRTLALSNVAVIKSFATTQPNPAAVYTAANIPAPKPPAHNQAPGQCTDVRANLNTVNGELRLTWKCSNPGTTNGTVYTIERRVGTSGAWTPLGLSSIKSFTDLTLPVAAGGVVQYNITATRSGLVGTPSGAVSVVFGHAPNGEAFVASVSTGTPSVKIAA